VSRILYFTRSYNSHDHRFLAAMCDSGHEVFYLTLERGAQVLEDRPLPPGVQRLHWSRELVEARLSDGPRLVLELRRLLRQVQPDLVQAGPLQRTALLVALAGFRPLVSMSWGYDLLIDAQRGRSWAWATRYALSRSAALVTDSQATTQLAVKYGMDPRRIVSFPWGIDLKHFHPPLRPPVAVPDDAPFTLLSTRSWEPIYGVDVLARGFALAAAQRPALRLVMLGGGSQAALLRSILSGVGGLGAVGEPTGRVLFPGQIGYRDLPGLYRQCQLYVSASHSDGSSISLLEAQACGLPALVSDIPGNREWVTPGQNGWLFSDGDANALAQAILTAYDQRHTLPEMSHNARRLAEARADWTQNYLRLNDAYHIALA
jgi:glycosyltransferase involved in cell wall biosynthesis